MLEIEGAKDVAVELHLFSKTYNMQGFRIGWVCGNKNILKALSIVKTNTDSGVFNPIQEAGIKAIEIYEKFAPKLREIYKKRRKMVKEYLQKAGWKYFDSDSTIYIWAEIGLKIKDSIKIVTELIDKKGVMIGPRAGYGKYEEGFLRFSITEQEKRLKEGMERFLDYLKEVY